jgi:hypothetical protein
VRAGGLRGEGGRFCWPGPSAEDGLPIRWQKRALSSFDEALKPGHVEGGGSEKGRLARGPDGDRPSPTISRCDPTRRHFLRASKSIVKTICETSFNSSESLNVLVGMLATRYLARSRTLIRAISGPRRWNFGRPYDHRLGFRKHLARLANLKVNENLPSVASAIDQTRADGGHWRLQEQDSSGSIRKTGSPAPGPRTLATFRR